MQKLTPPFRAQPAVEIAQPAPVEIAQPGPAPVEIAQPAPVQEDAPHPRFRIAEKIVAKLKETHGALLLESMLWSGGDITIASPPNTFIYLQADASAADPPALDYLIT